MRKLLALGSVLILAGAGCAAVPPSVVENNTPDQNQSQAAQGEKQGTEVSAPASFTMAEVQIANNTEKCWTVVNGKVYDLTKAQNVHPGGKQAILSLCGKDGTQAFSKQHGGKEKPENVLKSLQIGILK